MFNIIRSELYKTRHRKYPYILIGILSAFILFFLSPLRRFKIESTTQT